MVAPCPWKTRRRRPTVSTAPSSALPCRCWSPKSNERHGLSPQPPPRQAAH